MSRPLRFAFVFAFVFPACTGDDGGDGAEPLDPDAAEVLAIDRFSPEAGTLMVRDDNPDLPGPNEPIDFDAGFWAQGYGPTGEVARYYNLDVRPDIAQKGYLFYREGEDTPVEGQLPVTEFIPGEEGYNDFWHLHEVTVPTDYVANTLGSAEAVEASGYTIEPVEQVLNRPLVPAGSMATMRPDGNGEIELARAWIGEKVAYYLDFDEAEIPLVNGKVHYSDIYVCFNINPGEDGGGPPSGFCDEGNGQTHNLITSVPGEVDYSPFWAVSAFDKADFDAVVDEDSFVDIELVAAQIAFVNCPVAQF
jgi:hypothetical protein